jgi:hypothetical protein
MSGAVPSVATSVIAAGGSADPAWIELRVHGVSGTPPESSLLCDHVVQVAGDSRGQFFRPADSWRRPVPGTSGQYLEAYHWGHYTSGNRLQSLWLLLLPFGLVNAAQFMLPRHESNVQRVLHAVAGAALRVVALALSCVSLFGVAVVSMDLGAWQWAGAGYDHRYGNLVWALVPPLGMLTLLAVMGRSHGTGQLPSDPEKPDVPQLAQLAPATDDKPDTPLATQHFFVGEVGALPLRALHAAAVLGMLTELVLWPAAQDGCTAARVTRVVVGVLIGLTALVTLVAGDLTSSASQPAGARWNAAVDVVHRIARPVCYALFYLAGAALVWAAVFALRHGAGPLGCAGGAGCVRRMSGEMPGVDQLAEVMLVVTTAALVVLALALAVLAPLSAASRQARDDVAERERQRAFRPYAFGMTAVLMASVGAFLAVGFAAAAVLGCQQLMSLIRTAGVVLLRSSWRPARFTLPAILERVDYAWGLTVALVLACVLTMIVSRLCRARACRAAVTAAFDAGPAPSAVPASQLDAAASALFSARLKNAIPVLAAIFATAGLVLTIAAGVEQYRGWRDFLGLGWLSATFADTNELAITWVGVVALSGLALGVVLLAHDAIGSENSRRGLNVAWDVISYWPRSVHPLVPASYSQFVTADLRRRISYLLGRYPGARLALAGHSQGSLISLTALLWLPAEERRRVGLVTFGSQIRIMFSRAVPAYLNEKVAGFVLDAYAGRWCNLYRDTDPLAGPVLSWDHRSVTRSDQWARTWAVPTQRQAPAQTDPDTGCRQYGTELRLLDPAVSPPPLLMTSAPVLRQHSDYPADPDWPAALRVAGIPAQP